MRFSTLSAPARHLRAGWDEARRLRLPDAAHTSRPWAIHRLAPDFALEDVWALPTPGGPDDLQRLVEMVAGGELRGGSSKASRMLFAIRWKIGELLGWDDDAEAGGSPRPTLRDRFGPELRDAPTGPTAPDSPFTALYLLRDEYAAEIVNATVHAVLHLGWVADGDVHRGQMAVLVKPNGILGHAYMAAIRPFRYLIVYPPMIRGLGRAWAARADGDTSQARCPDPDPCSPPSTTTPPPVGSRSASPTGR
jgi:hypothetical protein